MRKQPRIVVNPNIRFGKPIIRGTRIAVADILNLLAAGYTIEEVPEQYPGITKADVLAALEYTSGILENPARVLQLVAQSKV